MLRNVFQNRFLISEKTYNEDYFEVTLVLTRL